MIRVAVVLNKFDAGGIESIVKNYYKNFDHNKVQCDFYFANDSSIPNRDELIKLGAGLYPMPSYKHFIKYIFEHKKLFEEKKYSIVHAHVNTMSFLSLFAAKLANVRVRICHAHTMASISEGKVKYLLKYLSRPLNKIFATELFACSETVGKWMYGKKPFKVISNAINTDSFKFDLNARKEIRNRLGVDDNTLLIGHVGRFIPVKNHEFLLEILEMLPNAKLLLVGDGPLFDKIEGERVIKVGGVLDTSRYYSAMDVFALPSHMEGLPVVVIEAQANGLKCICSPAVTKEADFGGMITCELAAGSWANEIKKANRFEPLIPDERNISKASIALQYWYEQNNDYISVYVRNSTEGPACYYRICQYAQPNWKINNAYSKKQYRKNFDMQSKFFKKLYQGYLFIVTNINRRKSLRYDIKYHPKKVIIQREISPKLITPITFSLLTKMKNIIWDFDDDIRLEGECSKKEFEFLKANASEIVVTSQYLNNMVGGKAMLLPTTEKSSINIDEVIKKRKQTYYSDFRAVWIGSYSNLENLDLVDIPGIRVVCNKPYSGDVVNIKWTRQVANQELMNAHVGIMPLKDKPYNYGKGGFKIIQYMSVGLPVLASGIGYNREIVSDDFGLLDDFDISKVSNNIETWEKMSRNSYDAYQKYYSFDKNLSFWKKLLS